MTERIVPLPTVTCLYGLRGWLLLEVAGILRLVRRRIHDLRGLGGLAV